MSTSDVATRSFLRNPVWIGVGAVVLLLVLAFVFVEVGSKRMWRDYHNEAPPGRTAPAPPAPGV